MMDSMKESTKRELKCNLHLIEFKLLLASSYCCPKFRKFEFIRTYCVSNKCDSFWYSVSRMNRNSFHLPFCENIKRMLNLICPLGLIANSFCVTHRHIESFMDDGEWNKSEKPIIWWWTSFCDTSQTINELNTCVSGQQTIHKFLAIHAGLSGQVISWSIKIKDISNVPFAVIF